MTLMTPSRWRLAGIAAGVLCALCLTFIAFDVALAEMAAPAAPAAAEPTVNKGDVAWMLIYGEQDQDQVTDANRIFRQLERFHPEPASAQAAPRDLVMMPVPTALSGSSLFSQAGAGIEESIIRFLTEHVAEKDLQWSKRRNRLD